MNNYDLLIQKLDAFIRKYYLNRLLRGLLVFAACVLSAFLFLSFGEYFLYLPAFLKLAILSVIGILGLWALYAWILLPLLQMKQLGQTISHNEAAKIIGEHFHEVEDKLLNVLQLKANSNQLESRELVEASIRQKSTALTVLPFSKVVDLKENRKYLVYIAPLAAIILFVFFVAPEVFTTTSERWLQPSKEFSRPAPFSFHLMNSDLNVAANSDFTLKVKVEGEKLPYEVAVVVGKEELMMEKIDNTTFHYTFKNVSEALDFQMKAGKVNSPKYQLNVFQRPLPGNFSLKIIYPNHTGIPEEERKGFTDLAVPQGSRLVWSISAKHTDAAKVRIGNSNDNLPMLQKSPEQWEFRDVVYQDTSYTFYLDGTHFRNADSFHYLVTAIQDRRPNVTLQQFKDTVFGNQILLSGYAHDDYGLTAMAVHFVVFDANREKIKAHKIQLNKPKGKIASFQEYFDLTTIATQSGQQVDYFVEAWDNDGINGSKKGVSETFTYRIPAKAELDSLIKENSEQINKGLSSGANQSRQINQEMEEMRTDLLQSQNMSWEQEQQLKKILDRQNRLKEQVEVLKKRFDTQKRHSEEKDFSDRIREKQTALEKQMDQLLNKELAEQVRKLQEMLEQKNRANTVENLEKMQEANKLFSMEMERIQELMKNLELQMKMEDLANKVAEIAKAERDLQKKTQNAEQSNKSLSAEQKELKKEFEKLMKDDFSEIEKKNKEQRTPQNLERPKESAKKASDEMQRSSDALEKADEKTAQKSQDEAAQSLEEMAKNMSQMAAAMDMQQIDMDIKAVRQLLTNLIRLSFDQEELMEKERLIPITSPQFGEHAKTQQRLKKNSEMIKDSLYALSKRAFQLAPTINKETSELSKNIDKSLRSLEARRVGEARVHQQFAMSNANNLALLLNETLSNLLQMQGQMSGEGEGQPQPGQGKPGKGGPGSAGQKMKDIITGQQQLGEGMKQLQEGQEQGGSGSGGQNGGEGPQSEQLVRLAREQALLRRQIQELSSMLNSAGFKGDHAKELREIQEAMDKNETDFVNRRLNPQLIRRQQDILTRLLQAEKSIRNQEEDDKRSATSGKDLARPMPPELKKYLQQQAEIFEKYNAAQPVLKPFYRRMSEAYLQQVRQQ